MDVYVWVYKSREVAPLSEDDIASILNVSRLYNRDHDITGILLYNEGRFTQVIEGDRDDIIALKTRISLDSRHTDIITIYEGEEENRIFSSWSMAFHAHQLGAANRGNGQCPGPHFGCIQTYGEMGFRS
jgi:hypothetical protein